MTELIAHLLPYIVFVLVFLPLLLFLGWRDFVKRYRRSGRLDNVIVFAFRTLGISQAVTLGLFFGFLFLTFGFGLFVAPLIVFLNALAAILTFLFAIITYPLVKKRALNSSLTPATNQHLSLINPTNSTYAYAILGILAPASIFLGLNGMSHVHYFMAIFAVETGNVEMIARLPYEHQRTYRYHEMAVTNQDTSFCDRIETDRGKATCYEHTDPEFKTYQDTCELYTKHGDLAIAYHTQFRCLEKEIKSTPYNALDCNEIVGRFSENNAKRINFLRSECQRRSTYVSPAENEKYAINEPNSTQDDDINVKFLVTPATGTAPLTANIDVHVISSSTEHKTALVFFGDGTTSLIGRISPNTFGKASTHTFTKPGEYDVMLVLSSVNNVDTDIQVLQDPYYSKNTIIEKVKVIVTE